MLSLQSKLGAALFDELLRKSENLRQKKGNLIGCQEDKTRKWRCFKLNFIFCKSAQESLVARQNSN